MSRVVVVGAGVGGLATAARLARAGHQVTVFERSGTVGGILDGRPGVAGGHAGTSTFAAALVAGAAA